MKKGKEKVRKNLQPRKQFYHPVLISSIGVDNFTMNFFNFAKVIIGRCTKDPESYQWWASKENETKTSIQVSNPQTSQHHFDIAFVIV